MYKNGTFEITQKRVHYYCTTEGDVYGFRKDEELQISNFAGNLLEPGIRVHLRVVLFVELCCTFHGVEHKVI